jgi:hypothetical protein
VRLVLASSGQWRGATGSGQQRAMARCDQFWQTPGDGVVQPVLADIGHAHVKLC